MVARRWTVLLGLVTAISLGCSSDGGGGDTGGGGGPMDPPPGGPDFTQNGEFAGVFNVDVLNIPAGVTITATGDLTINVAGDITIAGSIVGDCVAIVINGGGDVNFTGTINNACTVDDEGADPKPLTIAGDGNMNFNGGTIVVDGELEITNDPTLTDADFDVSIAPTGLVLAQGRVSIFINQMVVPSSPRRRNGSDRDPTGGPGGNAFRKTLTLRGDVSFQGGNVIRGQHGGHGGDGTDMSTPVSAEGGRGGRGGKVTIRATGDLDFLGTNTVVSGDGGSGGDGTGRAPTGAAARAPSATATGGKGGEPGLMKISAGDALSVGADLTMEVGSGGPGGEALAVGASGDKCVDGSGAQDGGTATATGGEGGSSPNERLISGGNVAGVPTVSGADAGDGGKATAAAGNGYDGQNCDDCVDGGEGGTMTATGGKGGAAELRDGQNMIVGFRGDGGDAEFQDGNGGDAFPDCCNDDGGAGGKGGDTKGAAGDQGDEGLGGADGNVIVIVAANGGDGGKGNGAGGAEGTNTATGGGPMISDPSYVPGMDADPCPGVPPPTFVSPPGDDITGTHKETVVNFVGSAGSCPSPFAQGSMLTGLQITHSSPNLSINRGNRISANVSGNYDSTTGAWTGIGTQVLSNLFTVTETWTGTWTKETTTGMVFFEGTKEIKHFDPSGTLVCTETYEIDLDRTGN